MSASVHQFKVKGVDNTRAVFTSIKNRASATSAQIRTIVGAALTASGAYLSMGKFMKGVNELSHLSDIAQKTSTTTDELTSLSTALKVLGVQGAEVDNLGKSFDYMAKETGRTGLSGFYQSIEEIGKIADVSERSQAAIKVFGRSGMEFMPLINAATEGTKALRGVVEAMGGVSQAAAIAGDDAGDSVTILRNKINNLCLEGTAAILKLFHGDFRGGAVALGAYAEYGAKVAWRYLKAFFSSGEDGVERYKQVWNGFKQSVIRNVVTMSAVCYEYIKTIPERFIAGVAGGIFGMLGAFNRQFREFHNELMADWHESISTGMWMNVDKDLKSLGVDLHDTIQKNITDAFKDVSTDDLEKRLEDALDKASKVTENVNNAVGAMVGGSGKVGGGSNQLGGLFGGIDIGRLPQQINNDLILGGSNAATRLQILGPTLQIESKKQTEILNQMNEKLGKLVDNTDDSNMPEIGTVDV